jgi:23S rRNA G2069 N7-methylase RlmK/C1962 C5-methylase RlmI
LLKILSYRRQLDHDDLMSVTYYLLLQDRVEEAIDFFGRVNPQQLATRMQHDYFTAYLAFSQEQPERAKAIVDRYAEYPVDRWRKAFAEIGAQLAEIGGQAAAIVDDTRTATRCRPVWRRANRVSISVSKRDRSRSTTRT